MRLAKGPRPVDGKSDSSRRKTTALAPVVEPEPRSKPNPEVEPEDTEVATILAMPGTEVGRMGQLLLQSWLLLLVSDSPNHGYQLLEALRKLGIRLGNSGYVYRTLRSLEASGILASCWQRSDGGPPHRVYELTPAGRTALDHCATGVACLDAQLQDYLARYRKIRGDASVVGTVVAAPVR